jgi:transposase
LFPQLAGVSVDRVVLAGKSVQVLARTCGSQASCPACGMSSRRVHSSYERRLANTAVSVQQTLIRLRVRRFACVTGSCPKKTFAEQVPGLTSRYARRTAGLSRLLGRVALTLGGRAGARLTGHLAAEVSRSTLLRLISALPDLQPATPRVLGVDEFALRRGHSYGTLLVDVESRQPVDILPERSAESFRAWLDDHPGAEVICRDRGGCHADGAARGAPAAVQVANRWHLLHNLAGAVERAVARHRSCLREQAALPEPAQLARAAAEGPLAQRTRARHAEIRAALARGLNLMQISLLLDLNRTTVRRYARAADPGDLIAATPPGRASLLDPHLAYLQQRWDQGCRSTSRLHEEIRARGYRGSLRTLRRHTAGLARPPPARPRRPRPHRER